MIIFNSLILFLNLFFTNCTSKYKDKVEKFTHIKSIPTPKGFKRIEVDSNSFADYLRDLPLKTDNNIVYLYNKQPKGNQNAQFRVVQMDIGSRDLQQCADAVMRLRAEYLWINKAYQKIHFNFTSGDKADFTKYMKGDRPVIKGNKVTWTNSGIPTSGYRCFRNYMDMVFTYAGTASLSKELKKVPSTNDMKIGDVFIQTGNPYGHAVIVVDMAKNAQTGEKVFMLAQSYMPAQEIHLLKNPKSNDLNPWYPVDFDETLHTPEWTFKPEDLKRFP